MPPLAALVEIIKEMGAEVAAAHLVPDEPEQIQALLRRLADGVYPQ